MTENKVEKPEFCYKVVEQGRFITPQGHTHPCTFHSCVVPVRSAICLFYDIGIRTKAHPNTPGVSVFLDLERAKEWSLDVGVECEILKCRYSRSTLRPRRTFPLNGAELHVFAFHASPEFLVELLKKSVKYRRAMRAPSGTHITKWVEPVEVVTNAGRLPSPA